MRRMQAAAYALIVGMFAFGLWLVEHRFCEQGNKGRNELRHALADVLTENLVEAAREPPDPVVVERYRNGLLEDLEREFPGRDCI